MWFWIGLAFVVLFFIGKIIETWKNAGEEWNREQAKAIRQQYNDTLIVKVDRSFKEDKDSFEGWFYEEAQEYFPIKKTLSIKYKDANGTITTRTIITKQVEQVSGGDALILSWCTKREANRTFRINRMLEVIDSETGEYIKDLYSYLFDAYQKSDYYANMQAREKAQNEKLAQAEYIKYLQTKYNVFIKIVTYLVKCDGTYNQREKAIVKEIFKGLEDSNELLTEKVLNTIIANAPLPSTQTFKVNVAKFLKDGTIKIDLLELAANIIATQKNIHPSEQEALDFIKSKISDA